MEEFAKALTLWQRVANTEKFEQIYLEKFWQWQGTSLKNTKYPGYLGFLIWAESVT